MDRLAFAAVADDDTGASDLAGMLAEQGLRTLLLIDPPPADQFLQWSRGHHAVVLAAGTRNLTPAGARGRTGEAIRVMLARRPRVLQVKYCSTFDSTPEGNIGPSIEAALDALGETFTIAVPALPVNGRTTYMGHHFVHGQLLSDSPMRTHPLTPMTNPNLVGLLGQQTTLKVGLAPYRRVEAGPAELRACFDDLRGEGVRIAVVDCLSDAHLKTICRAASDLRLLTGSSAFGVEMPSVWRERGWLDVEDRDASSHPIPAAPARKGCLLIAGSCSIATREQNEWIAARGAKVTTLDPRDLLTGTLDRAALVERVGGQLAAGRHCLLATSAEASEVRRVQEWGAARGFTVPAMGEAIAGALADIALELLRDDGAAGLIAAGGETSGALCRRLGLGALRVGRNIEPGVPLCFSLGQLRLPVVLKSGNFGTRGFYGEALRAVAHPHEYLS